MAQTTFDEGRQAQFLAMLDALSKLQAKYRGVRGELLAKVREELEQLDPATSPVSRATVSTMTPMKVVTDDASLPSCRACGRAMKPKGDGTLMCQNGHTRLLAG